MKLNFMSDSAESNHSEVLTFLAERLNGHPLILSLTAQAAAVCAELDDYAAQQQLGQVEWLPAKVAAMLSGADRPSGPTGVALEAGRTLVLAAVASEDLPQSVMLSVQHGPVPLACLAVRNALEAWKLHCEARASQQALEESAMQLAQSFEEQNWLRNFARNATTLSRGSSANDMASGILQPLGYLLRAQDVFLLVDPDETLRSGLNDSQYGASKFSPSAIRELLSELMVGPHSPPLVKNNVSLMTANGIIHSLIVVSVHSQQNHLGHLVGINRSAKTLADGALADEPYADGLPCYDPEFGSGDVGLLEEAAVLLATQAHNIHLLVQSNQQFLGTLHAMSSAIDARDEYTQGHSQRVARLAFELARIYGLSEEACQEIYLAGILHDIGKIGVPDRVLLKNGPLDDEEFRIIKMHPEIGYRIVERLGNLQFVLPGVLYHHERWDGRGYPQGLQGETIPVMARLMAVADAFDAMTSSRPYRNAMPVQRAREIILEGAGQQWDAQAVECFKLWLDRRAWQEHVQGESNASIIPTDSPVEQLMQAVMVLGH